MSVGDEILSTAVVYPFAPSSGAPAARLPDLAPVDSDLWQAILYVHLTAVAFFFGGQLVLGAVIVPVERANPDRERLRAMARRFGIGSLIALAVLVITGVALASHLHLWSSSTLQIKLALVIAVLVLTLAHLRWPRAHALQAAVLLATAVIVWLGLELVV
jgi:putative copper export protein